MAKYKLIALTALIIVAFGMTALAIAADIPKQGTYTGKMVISLTLKSIAVGDRLIVGYEYMGVFLNDRGEGFLHNASVRGLGAFHAENVKGVFEYDRSSGVLIDSDGDQVIFTHEVAGSFDSVRTLTFHGGTGKYTGIQGGGEWTWVQTRSATEVTAQGYAIHKGHWKLP